MQCPHHTWERDSLPLQDRSPLPMLFQLETNCMGFAGKQTFLGRTPLRGPGRIAQTRYVNGRVQVSVFGCFAFWKLWFQLRAGSPATLLRGLISLRGFRRPQLDALADWCGRCRRHTQMIPTKQHRETCCFLEDLFMLFQRCCTINIFLTMGLHFHASGSQRFASPRSQLGRLQVFVPMSRI